MRARASLPELPSGAARTLACGPNQEVVGSITYIQARRRAGCAPVCMQPRSPPLSLSKNGIFHSTFKVMLCRRHYLVQREIPSRKGRKSWSLPHTLSLDGVVLWWWCVTQPSWMHFLVGRQPVQLRCARRAGNPRVVCPAPSRGSRRFVAVAPQSRQ